MLNESVSKVKGVGEKLAIDLENMNIYTIEDLLFYFPSRYDVFEIKPLGELIHEDKVTIEGKVLNEPHLSFFGRNRSRLMFNLEVDQIVVKAVIFNRSFAKDRKSTRLNSSHVAISYAAFSWKKKDTQ